MHLHNPGLGDVGCGLFFVCTTKAPWALPFASGVALGLLGDIFFKFRIATCCHIGTFKESCTSQHGQQKVISISTSPCFCSCKVLKRFTMTKSNSGFGTTKEIWGVHRGTASSEVINHHAIFPFSSTDTAPATCDGALFTRGELANCGWCEDGQRASQPAGHTPAPEDPAPGCLGGGAL